MIENIFVFFLKIKQFFVNASEAIDNNFAKFFISVFFFKSLIIDISQVPSGSMTPTAHTGDIVLVNRMSFGWNRNSFQYIGGKIPFFKKKYFYNGIKRGDPIIFTLPRDSKTIYFKRAIGLPGDTIQIKKGVIHINDQPVKIEDCGRYEILSDDGTYKEKGKKYKITLDNGVSFFSFRNCEFNMGHRDNTMKYIIPEGYFLPMGDNSTSSDDGLNMDFMAIVPIENLMGKPITTIVGSHSRQKTEPNLIAWILRMPFSIPTYLINLDITRIFKKL